MGSRLAVTVCKCPRLKTCTNNGRCLNSISQTTEVNKEGNNRRLSVYTINNRVCVCQCV